MPVDVDDILVFSQTFDEHLERLEIVLKCFLDKVLKVKLQKYNFLQVSSNGTGTDSSK